MVGQVTDVVKGRLDGLGTPRSPSARQRSAPDVRARSSAERARRRPRPAPPRWPAVRRRRLEHDRWPRLPGTLGRRDARALVRRLPPRRRHRDRALGMSGRAGDGVRGSVHRCADSSRNPRWGPATLALDGVEVIEVARWRREGHGRPGEFVLAGNGPRRPSRTGSTKASTSSGDGQKAEQSDATRSALLRQPRGGCSPSAAYAATSTNEIVERAGVTRGALYHHFPAKHDLFRAVFEQLEDEIAEHVAREALAGIGPARAAPPRLSRLPRHLPRSGRAAHRHRRGPGRARLGDMARDRGALRPRPRRRGRRGSGRRRARRGAAGRTARQRALRRARRKPAWSSPAPTTRAPPAPRWKRRWTACSTGSRYVES